MAVIVIIFVIGLLAVADKLAHCVKDVTFQSYVGAALNGPLILVEHNFAAGSVFIARLELTGWNS